MTNLNDINLMNLSTKFQKEQLGDPINYNVSTRSVNCASSAIPACYALKARQVKERDSLGGFKISQDHLKKHINPSDEYEAKLALLQEKKIQLLKLNQTSLSGTNAYSNGQYANQPQASRCFDPLLPANQNLIAMIDMQVAQLKQETEEYAKDLANNGLGPIKEEELEVKEKDVANQFLCATADRVQVIKHVQTQMKPEYMSLESIQKEKEANRLKLLELEKRYKEIKANPMQAIIDDSCNQKGVKPGITLEELNAILKQENELFHFEEKLKKKAKTKAPLSQQALKPHSCNLNQQQEKYVKKLAKYVLKKKAEGTSQDYQLNDWNKTRIHSKHIAGVVDRKDGLPGHLDAQDLSLYYSNIVESSSTVVGASKSRPKTMKRSTSNSRSKLNTSKEECDLNLSASQLSRNRFVLSEEVSQKRSNQELINLIFTLIDKNGIDLVEKERVMNEMEFDNKTMLQLGFKSREDFCSRLNSYSTELAGRVNQKEFASFLSTKGRSPSPQKNQINLVNTVRTSLKPNETKIAESVTSPPLFYESNNYLSNEEPLQKKEEDAAEDDFLPVPQLRDILKNTSNVKRLQLLKQTLKSAATEPKQRARSTKPKPKPKPKATYEDYQTVINKYNDKEKINFTIPKPFSVEAKGSSHGAMKRMKTLLEERQAEEEGIYVNQRFKAKNLKNEMFIGNIDKVIESDKKERRIRTEKLMEKIQDDMKPFSFVDKDQRKYHERVNKKEDTPQYPQFKANQVNWKSKVAILEGLDEQTQRERRKRIEEHAKQTLEKSKLPPRLEQHEKEKQEHSKQLEQIKLKERQRQRQRRPKTAQDQQGKGNKLDVPDFNKLHEINRNNLEKKKKKAMPTVIEPFNLHETKKKAQLDYLNEAGYEEEDPQFKQNIHSMISKMQKKASNEPSSTTGHKLLIEARRKEQEQRKKDEESRKVEDAQRKIEKTRMKDRVQQSDALKDTKKGAYRNGFEQTQKKKETEMNRYLNITKQRVTNRPLLFEDRSNVNTLIRRQQMQQLIQDAIEGEEDEHEKEKNDEEEQFNENENNEEQKEGENEEERDNEPNEVNEEENGEGGVEEQNEDNNENNGEDNLINEEENEKEYDLNKQEGEEADNEEQDNVNNGSRQNDEDY